MESRTIYSMMALSVIPGAAVQAAVGVQTGTAIMSAENKVEIDFGTLYPGKYNFSAIVTEGTVTQANLGGVSAKISGPAISASITLTEMTQVKFVAEGANPFTLAAYDLKLDWEPDAAPLNTLYDAVSGKVLAWDNVLSATNKELLNSNLATQKGFIDAVAGADTDAKKYEVYRNYKFYNEPDDITAALNGIQDDANRFYIDDCWEAKQAAYNTFLEPFSAVSLTELQTAINGLTDTKDKRLTALDGIQTKLDAFKAGADAALGQKAEDVEAATPTFTYEPDPDLDAIKADIKALTDLVAQDNANTTNFEALKTNQTEALASLHELQTKINAAQKNAAQKATNAETASGYETELDNYLTAAQGNYNTAVENDGQFDYDLESAELNTIKDKISALNKLVDDQNADYETANEAIQGFFTAAGEYYETQLAAVTEAVSEAAYVDILEKAQSDLLAKKTTLTERQDAYTLKYTAGEDLVAATAEGEVNTIKDEMKDVVDGATAEANGYRTVYNTFMQQIAAQKDRLEEVKGAENYAQIQGIIGEQVNTLSEKLEELESNLAIANAAPHAIGENGFVPKAYDNETTIEAAATAIDNLNVAGIVAELEAYNTLQTAIADLGTSLETKKAAVKEKDNDEQRAGYDVEAPWAELVAAIQQEIEALGAAVTELYGDGTTGQLQKAKAEKDEAVTNIQERINQYETDAYEAINKYRSYYWAINEPNTNTDTKLKGGTKARLAKLRAMAEGKAMYDDYTYLYVEGNSYKDKLDAIQTKIEEAESALATACAKTGADHLAAMEALDYTSYKSNTNMNFKDGSSIGRGTSLSLTAALNYLRADNYAQWIDEDYETYGMSGVIKYLQDKYDEAVAATVVDAIAASYNDAKAALVTAIATSKDAKTAEDLGNQAEAINNAYTALAGAADELGLAETDNTAILKLKKYNELLKTIGKADDAASAEGSLYAQLKKIEADADAAKQAKAADAVAQTALATSLADLKQERAAAGTHTAEECKDVPNSYDFGVIDAAIEALEGNITAAATAQNTVAKQNEFDAEITRISGLIQTEVAKADNAQAKYTANAELTDKYNKVNSYLGEQRAQVGAVAGNQPDAVDQEAIKFYKNMFNGEGGFVEQLAAIKADLKAKNESDVEVSTYKESLSKQLDDLKTEIGKVLPLAKANKASYDAQMESYDATVDIYDDNYAVLTGDKYNQDLDVVKTAKTQMESYAYTEGGELAQLLATIQNSYKEGKAVEVETANISEAGVISAAIQNIISTLDNDDYGIAVRAQNADTYSNTALPKIQEIQEAYAAAVAVLDDYKGAKDEGIRNAVEESSEALNNAVFEAPTKKTEFTQRAKNEQAAADGATPAVIWDTTQLLADIDAYIEELNAKKTAFTSAVEDQIKLTWESQKNLRNNYLNSIFSRLGTSRYLDQETKDEIFVQQTNWIAQGDAIVNPEEGAISISALDALLETDGFSSSTFTNNILQAANDFAKTKVDAMLEPYIKEETGKQYTDWAEIAEIIKNGYDTPEGEKSIEDQFNGYVSQYLSETKPGAQYLLKYRYNRKTLYAYSKSNFSNLLNNYDNAIATLKANAEQWAQAKVDREAAKAALTESVATANTAIDDLEAKIKNTSVGDNYDDDIQDIRQVVSDANAAESIDDINDAQNVVDGIAELLEALEDDVVTSVLDAAGNNVNDLKIEFNKYAAVDNPDEATQAKIGELSSRINAVISTIENGTDIDGAIALEKEIDLLLTELAQLNDATFAADVQALADRAAVLQNAKLPEADYGDKAEDYAQRLAAINEAGESIAADIESHKEAQNIKPYMTGINAQLTTQERDLENLQTEAAGQAEQVATNKANLKSLNDRLNALSEAELTGEYNPIVTQQLQARLNNIMREVDIQKNEITENAQYIQYNNENWSTQISELEEQWTQLQADAAEAAQQWAEQKAASDAIYETLGKKLDEVVAAQEAAKAAIAEMSIEDQLSDWIEWNDSQVNTIKQSITDDNTNKTLTEDDLDEETEISYVNQLTSIKNDIADMLNWAAYLEAKALFTNAGSDLKEAQNGAWDAWRQWSFATSVRTALSTELSNYDREVAALTDLIEADYNVNNSYASMATYAEKASELIANYNAVKERMASFKPFGDANGDGKVNAADYTKAANMILDPTLQPAADSDLFLVTDVNQNDVIEVGDLTGIVNIIMGRSYDVAGSRALRANGESLTTTASQTQVGTKRIAVNLKNVNEYTAFQLDVVLPEGMKIVGKQLGSRAADSHNLWSREQQDGSIRFLASSIKGDTFKGADGAVLYIDVEGAGNVELVNVLFSDVTAATRSFSVGDEATGINATSTFETLKQKVYDLSGRVKDGLKKGINIIRRADGSTQKVAK